MASILYSEYSDPTDFSTYQLPVIPKNPAHFQSPNRFQFYSYDHILKPITIHPGYFVEFPFRSIEVHKDLTVVEEGCDSQVYFYGPHTFLNFYNHSDHMKMVLHNQYLQRKANFQYILPPYFFKTSAHFYLFCGTVTIDQVEADVKDFNFLEFLIA